ncbi:NAD-dependent epimerase/dehydratase family protein [Paenibacillus sp. J5C_2022]|uniref:NAD-dependent epimerase/dehydratase family protein n=1 Tax=Paenibacillus sp. J5C2022 TaxID=2977129 RepID=UPI0021D0F7F8|nr:NAD-dependent epimerase/dehydratase family protein [Paenibacillus sp. J5C2022]MCU6707307.1 NAD-dependent epimerase/dehydratase family protein [Paenibacillus sp. J5C2022]
MTKVLVIGGTRFFGKRLVQQWIAEQADITIVTRGNTTDPFGDAVKRLKVDRQHSETLAAAIGAERYDLVYDNICYLPQQAEQAAEVFNERTGKYIVTSSMAVYAFGNRSWREQDFDPFTHPLKRNGGQGEPGYAEGKRLVEAVMFRKAAFPVAAVRFPIVMGLDDYTDRLNFHIRHVQSGNPIGMPNPQARMSYIHADEAADFLYWLGKSELAGPVNACASGHISNEELIELISEATGKSGKLVQETDEAHQSPYGVPADWGLDTSKASAAGYTFTQLHEWLPALVREMAAQESVEAGETAEM